MPTINELKMLQALPLDIKIQKTILRIREWYYHFGGKVYISYSGGKDSTVLLDLVRREFPDVKAVFCNTGVEYPEIYEFVKTIPNVITLLPKKPFHKVVEELGYPVISKKISRQIRDLRKPDGVNDNTKNLIRTGYNRNGNYSQRFKISKKWEYLENAPFLISEQCCDNLKKNPFKQYEKETGEKAFIGTMTDDSELRKKNWLSRGCNAFDCALETSQPMSFWTEQDVLEYIYIYNLKYCDEIYGQLEKVEGKFKFSKLDRTGCMYCLFGIHKEKGKNRIQQMKESHPKCYDYCLRKENGLNYKEILEFLNIDYE